MSEIPNLAATADTSKTWRPPIIRVVPFNKTASCALLWPPSAGAGSIPWRRFSSLSFAPLPLCRAQVAQTLRA
eukprot:3510789-Pleurochrysis_carterae.AAC.1